MAGSNLGELVQMISALSGVQAQRQELKLREQQLNEMASQFAQTGEENRFAAALQTIAKSSAQSRQGLQGLLSTLSPEHREAAQAFLTGQPIDPSIQAAQAAQTGIQNMNPTTLAAVQQEAATRAMSGQGVGEVAASQLGGALAGGAIGAVTPQMQAAYAERAATGRDPLQAAIQGQQLADPRTVAFMSQVAAGQRMSAPQAANVALGYANVGVEKSKVNLGYANLDQDERKMAAYYGLDKMLKMAEVEKIRNGGVSGQATGPDWLDAQGKMANILNDINKNTSDKASNYARIRLFNITAANAGHPELMIPLEGEGAPGKLGLPTQFKNFLFGGPGLPSGGQNPWPTVTPTLQGGGR